MNQALSISGSLINFRELRVSDINAVNALYFEYYGRGYPYPLRALDQRGAMIVAEHESRIVGFARAMPYRDFARVYEFGGLIVHPAYRAQGLAGDLTGRRLQQARLLGGKKAAAEPVGNDPNCISQKNLSKFGFMAVGLEPFKYPDILQKQLGCQPESVLLMVANLNRHGYFGQRRLFIPEKWFDALLTLLPAEYRQTSWQQSFASAMPPVLREAANRGAESVGSEFVDIPANWEPAASLIREYVQQGYGFCGILPGFGLTEQGEPFDYIRLYRPPAMNFSFELIHVEPCFERFKQFMAHEYCGH